MDTASAGAADRRSVEAVVNWEVVYRQSLPKVFRYFSCWVGDDSLAEDLTSATFERAWASRGGFDGRKGSPLNWLLGIARNVKANHFRRRNAEGTIDEALDLHAAEMVEESVQLRRDFDRLYHLLRQLETRQRELIALKYGAELTNREIAKLTGLTETNVGTILHRVVNRLRAQWEDSE